ncbi:response regulator [Evansella cellulosilytica]|uniref:Two component transcriptional regulator, AraC family n=1 Tax=Evansella cellulosilytica (strain ATCC 21833 / DSM 2522 / FERM P-1141 / JCM 9156 / N-4) TaxID=649639 RepID=E6TWS3_EVAC2|nr:response regulator [Evansella cellulosilytica]ADU28756.1 two component transcriptional regulator, AraC family [Evansella cellulosilytica DSM 2522]
MIKLLIVDDEQIERDGMQVILSHAFPGVTIKQAKNGKEAILIADRFQPHLVLMDIKMPGMNGLESVQHLSNEYPLMKFIMVTAYDTFDYLKRAIKLGVKDYILKPSRASEIVTTVGKVLREVEEEQKKREMIEQQQYTLEKTLSIAETDVVTQLLFDHVHEIHLEMLLEMLDIRSINEMYVMVVLISTGSENMYSTIKEKVRKAGNSLIGALYGNQLPIIMFRDQDKSFRSQAVFMAREILSVAKVNKKTNCFIGIGEVCCSLEEIRKSYSESLVATMDTTLPVKYRFYCDVKSINVVGSEQRVKQREKEFAELIRLGEWEQIHKSIMNLIQSYENEGADTLQTQQRILELLWIVSRLMNEMGVETVSPFYSFQANDYRQLRSETNELLQQMRQLYTKHYDQLELDSIFLMKRYILEHSHEDISLDKLAKKVGLSPIYMSKLFKEKLGVNYIDFLTECRIEKAKQLLKRPDKSIKEITFDVGYHEPNYFSKVFKKMCGVSPKEYRKSIFNRN